MSETSSASEAPFAFGDRLRHRDKPEWGVGTVTRAEAIVANGDPTWRVGVRFPNAGLKTLVASAAPLERVEDDEPTGAPGASAMADAQRHADDELLGPMAQKKLRDAMAVLPERCTDPFKTIEQRVELTLELYRFEASGGSLIDWAVAQTGLDDPLSHFNRHELEEFFERWALERDRQLVRLLKESHGNGRDVSRLIPPPIAQRLKRVRI
ncbi:MAG: DUF3553 domain-containing protein [Phycisphaerales bacterium]|nr:DUF3553 domain-containing protein [Phycisphaerales bacterium]